MFFSELVNAVGDDLNRNDLTAQCSAAVIMAIRHYDHRRWWFNEGSSTFTATATTTYSLPTNFRKMDRVEYRDSGGRWNELKAKTFDEVRDYLDTTVTGDPCIYAIHDQKIIFDKSQAGTDERQVKLFYLKSLVSHSASASSAWTTDAGDLIRAAAAKTVAARTVHDTELAQIFGMTEQSELDRLYSENEGRVMTGMIKPHY